MSVEPDNNPAVTPCPGAKMSFTFDNLTEGQEYTITLDGGLAFTGASSGAGGVTISKTQAMFTAPTQSVSFELGVVISNEYVFFSTDLTASAQVSASLLSGSAKGAGGPLKIKALDFSMPPTCVVLNPTVPSCPVCAMDTSRCPEASAIRESQFCMGQHIFLCCLECPGESTPIHPD